MQTIDLKIPNDPAVINATADWLKRQVATIHTSQPETDEAIKFPLYYIHQESSCCGVISNNEEYETVINEPCAEIVDKDDYEKYKKMLEGAERHESKQGNDQTPASNAGESSDSATVQSVELDVNGLPWDPRIHASTKAKNSDGSWRYLRGVDKKELVPQVEAELKKAVEANNAAAGQEQEQEQEQKAPPPPPAGPQGAPAPPPPPPTQESNLKPLDQLTIADALAEVSQYKVDQLITPAEADAIASNHGLDEFMLLVSAPNLVGAVMADVRKAVAK